MRISKYNNKPMRFALRRKSKKRMHRNRETHTERRYAELMKIKNAIPHAMHRWNNIKTQRPGGRHVGKTLKFKRRCHTKT